MNAFLARMKLNRPSLTVRRFDPLPDDDVPRHWFHGEPAATHLLNAYTLLVPDNEGFYIRTLNEAGPLLQDLRLRNDVRAFSRQEGQHGVAHRKAWELLAAQGYRFERFVRVADRAAFGIVERFAPLNLRVAMVACVEHLNAAIGHEYLSRELMAGVHPRVRALFEWHLAEEIEHKAVSFEVLQTFRHAYALRLLSVALVVPLFYLLLGAGASMLMAQDGSLWRASTWRGWLGHALGGRGMARRMLGHIGHYLQPSFQPWALDDRHLVHAALARWSNVVAVAAGTEPQGESIDVARVA
jgi:predicted metal-dependent hydrolase